MLVPDFQPFLAVQAMPSSSRRASINACLPRRKRRGTAGERTSEPQIGRNGLETYWHMMEWWWNDYGYSWNIGETQDKYEHTAKRSRASSTFKPAEISSKVQFRTLSRIHIGSPSEKSPLIGVPQRYLTKIREGHFMSQNNSSCSLACK